MAGAQYMVTDGDVPVVESGGEKNFAYPEYRYAAAKADRVLCDEDEVRLGGAVLVAQDSGTYSRMYYVDAARKGGQATPRRGDRGKLVCESRVSAGGPVGTGSVISRTGAYERTFSVLKNLPCDVFLGAHGMYFDTLAKLAKIRAGTTENVWVDPLGYQAAVAERKAAFEAELMRQKQGSAGQNSAHNRR